MRRNVCDAYCYLHRKWANFASQFAMRYQLFPSLHTDHVMPIIRRTTWLQSHKRSLCENKLFKPPLASFYNKTSLYLVAHFRTMHQSCTEQFVSPNGYPIFARLRYSNSVYCVNKAVPDGSVSNIHLGYFTVARWHYFLQKSRTDRHTKPINGSKFHHSSYRLMLETITPVIKVHICFQLAFSTTICFSRAVACRPNIQLWLNKVISVYRNLSYLHEQGIEQ